MNWYRLAAKGDSLQERLREHKANKVPWAMTSKEFMRHHYTGHIRSDAYRNYATVEGLSWIKPENYPQHYATQMFGGVEVEIRRDNTKNGYVAHDEEGNILRDDKGQAVSMTDEQIKAHGLRVENGGLAAFVNGQCVGFASNEFGATGVWVVEAMQKKGLGTYLLREFRNSSQTTGPIGQMTNAGYNMTLAYHRKLVQDAIKAGKPVPYNVLEEHNAPVNSVEH